MKKIPLWLIPVLFFLFVITMCTVDMRSTSSPAAPTTGPRTPATPITVKETEGSFAKTVERYWGSRIEGNTPVALIVDAPANPYSCGTDGKALCVVEWYANAAAILGRDTLKRGDWYWTRDITAGSVIRLGTPCDMLAYARTTLKIAGNDYDGGKYTRIIGFSKDGGSGLSVQGYNWTPYTLMWNGQNMHERSLNVYPFTNIDAILGCAK